MTSPRALPPPPGDVVVISERLVVEALDASRASDRLRTILPFHKSHDDTLHRMFNALQPGTYVRPHRHLSVPKAEVFVVLRGAVDFVVFSEEGEVMVAERLAARSDRFGIDLAPGLFHAFLVCEPDTLIYEVKPGPYSQASDKDFAPWAPAEGSHDVPSYLERLAQQMDAFRAAR